MDKIKLLENCKLCPRECGVNRLEGKVGFCKSGSEVKISRAALHKWEEPCISGINGSGTVFFSNCTLGCVFCQNHVISQEGVGKEVSISRLSDIFLELQDKGANNINLVTATQYIPQIISALDLAKEKGLNIPVVYNTSGYEKIETLKLLHGYVDIYLPDFKYFNDKFSLRYSNAKGYSFFATKAIDEMVSQVGSPIFDENNIMKRGVIVRHLMLPGLLFDSKKIIDYLYNRYGDKIYISIMNQYIPLNNANKYEEINKYLDKRHYDSLINYAIKLGVENAFVQDEGTNIESYIPEFNGEGV
ncbi:radical SAM protein [Clostridium bornimense]|uniref:radical SAM protein n=1 Tax=Clostridium bornimense TaxID=1216932 RepID=UPI001C120030|nr:radical SAM protein [Clostridium bornimense]MBU5315305.1 radical SAM protein [Clostridium bornimense]